MCVKGGLMSFPTAFSVLNPPRTKLPVYLSIIGWPVVVASAIVDGSSVANIGGKGLEERGSAFKSILPRSVEPWASPQSAFAFFRLFIAKGTRWVYGGV